LLYNISKINGKKARKKIFYEGFCKKCRFLEFGKNFKKNFSHEKTKDVNEAAHHWIAQTLLVLVASKSFKKVEVLLRNSAFHHPRAA